MMGCDRLNPSIPAGIPVRRRGEAHPKAHGAALGDAGFLFCLFSNVRAARALRDVPCRPRLCRGTSSHPQRGARRGPWREGGWALVAWGAPGARRGLPRGRTSERGIGARGSRAGWVLERRCALACVALGPTLSDSWQPGLQASKRIAFPVSPTKSVDRGVHSLALTLGSVRLV